MPKVIKKIKILYENTKTEDKEILDEIFNYIFEKTVDKIGVDYLQPFSYTYNKDYEKRAKFSHSWSSCRQTPSPLADRLKLHQKQEVKSSQDR